MRLINADKLHAKLFENSLDPNGFVKDTTVRVADVLKMIDDAPTIPCRIAAGASWLKDDEKYTGNRVHCSICGYDIDVRVKTNYCPACGSRMDGIPPEWEVKLP